MDLRDKKRLFWDIDREKLDAKKHKEFIIERVLNRGRLKDFNWILEKYGEEEIKKVLRDKFYRLDEKSAGFWCMYFNINPKKCIQTRSELIQKEL